MGEKNINSLRLPGIADKLKFVKPDGVVASAKQLLSSIYTENDSPYLYRPTPADSDRERVKRLEGLSVGWNQMIGSVMGASGSGSGSGLTWTINADGSIVIDGTSTARQVITDYHTSGLVVNGHVYYIHNHKLVFHSPRGGWSLTSIDGKEASIVKATADGPEEGVRVECMSAGITFNNLKIYPQMVDLTICLGSAIADYIYSLEQATSDSGITWIRENYPKLLEDNPYSAPTIKSVEGLVSHVMTGFNQLNPVSFSIGANYNKNAGVTLQTDGTGATVSGENPIKVAVTTNWRGAVFFSNVLAKGVEYAVSYRITGSAPTNIKRTIWFVDKDNVIISKLSSSSSVEQGVNYVYTASYTPSEDGLRMALTFESATQQTVEVYDLCVHVRGDGTKDKVYEPYTVHSYPLDSTITLRGIPKLVDGKLVADGDWYEPSGKQTVRYGIVDLGSEDWYSYTSEGVTYFYTQAIRYLAKKPLSQADKANIICKYVTGTYVDISTLDKYVWLYTNGNLCIKDTSYSDVELFKSSLSGSYLVYELDTPTTSTASPYAEVQICDADGTEEFVTDSPVPVGTVTEYPADLRKQVENIYGIPPVPEEDGEYTLHATVAEGVKTFIWESEV